MKPRELFEWKNKGAPENLQARRILATARMAAGYGGTEEQLTRLMVWVGTSLHHCWRHSDIAHPIDVLREGTAWCDQYTKVFCFLCTYFWEFPTRRLRIGHARREGEGHSVAEVHYQGGWHLFDVHPDHQKTYRHPELGHIMSYTEIQQHIHVVEKEASWYEDKEGLFLGSCEIDSSVWEAKL